MKKPQPALYWICEFGHETVASYRPRCSVCTGETEKKNTRKNNIRKEQERRGWSVIPTNIKAHPADDPVNGCYWYQLQCNHCQKVYHWNQWKRIAEHRHERSQRAL